jgi:hypothetical protein
MPFHKNDPDSFASSLDQLIQFINEARSHNGTVRNINTIIDNHLCLFF